MVVVWNEPDAVAIGQRDVEEQDIPYAKKMLTLAARQGDLDAERLLESIKK